jgi:hypothetical protein
VKDPASGMVIGGVCCRSPLRKTTRYQDAVVAWSGILAELVVGAPNPTLDVGYPLRAETLREVFDMIVSKFETLSPTDRQLIAGYPSLWLTFKAAWKILRRQKAKLIRLATMKGQPPPSAEPTPAPPMKLEQVFDRYVSRQYRAILAQEQLAKLAPNDPDREVYSKALEFLRRDEEPPADLLPAPAQPAVS